MQYLTYLKERVWKMLLGGFWLFSINIFLLTFRNSQWLMGFIDITAIVNYVMIEYIEYKKKKNYYQNLENIAEQLDKTYLLSEMMEKTSCEEEKQLEQIIRCMGKAMTEHVNHYKYQNREYKEYIEIWIHEVKIPIATVKLILANHASEVSKSLEDEMKKIEDYTEQALYYARSNFVERDYMIMNLSLKEVVHQVLVRNKRSLIMKSTSVNIHDLDVEVLSDGKWLGFIIGQILSNSLKYANEKLTLEIYTTQVENVITLHIKDDGIGIAKEELPMVFEKCYTGTNGRQSVKSTGLGLYLCKKLCTRLGHGIAIESDGASGCEVTICFSRTSYYDTIS